MSQVYWEEFIQIYEENPCLWNYKCEDYTNDSKKNIAYGMLVEKLWEIDEKADLTTVKNKLKSFATSFDKEVERIEQRKKEGRNYLPVWRFYKPLLFLTPFTETLKQREIPSGDCKSTLPDSPKCLPDGISVTQTPEITSTDVQTPQVHNLAAANDLGNVAAKRAKLTDENRPDVLVDDSSTFAAHLTMRMRSFNPQQKCIAQKLISDVLFLAETKQLLLTTSIVNLAENSDSHDTDNILGK